MNIKRNIIFALEGRKKAGVPIVENVPIRMRVIFNSKRIEFTTGYRIDVAKWDADKQRVKNGSTNKLRQYKETSGQQWRLTRLHATQRQCCYQGIGAARTGVYGLAVGRYLAQTSCTENAANIDTSEHRRYTHIENAE